MGGLPDDVVNAVKSTGPFVEVVAAGESCAIETDDADRAAQSAAARLVDEAAGAMESCRKTRETRWAAPRSQARRAHRGEAQMLRSQARLAR